MLKKLYLSVLIIALFLIGCSTPVLYPNLPEKLPEPKPFSKPRVALVLGGGGARGVAHAGVISVLEENQIPFELIVGTSIGSIVGAIYADTPNSDVLRSKVIKVKSSDILDWHLYSGLRMIWQISGLADGHGLRNYLEKNLKARDFEQLKVPLAVVATDIESGQLITIRSGKIVPAVHASSAIPVVFTPVSIYNRLLIDGGVVSPVPVNVARQLGAEKVIAVDIGAVVKPRKVLGSYDLADRALWLSYMSLTKWELERADIVIQPSFSSTAIFDDTQLGEYYIAGRRAALSVLPELLKLKE